MKTDRLDSRYRTIAWGALLILIGSLDLAPGNQNQTGWAILGSGVILLGLNLLRSIGKIRVSGFSVALGAAAFLLGALVVIQSALGSHIEIELFPIMLIALGVYLLIPTCRRIKKKRVA